MTAKCDRHPMILLFCILWRIFLYPDIAQPMEPYDNVLKIFVTANSIDYYRPWQSHGSGSMTGSGCIIAKNRILTNAHVIADNTFIQVRKVSDPRKYTARVLSIGYDCDLALLTVDDPSFFKGVEPFEFGDLAKVRDTVTVVGYPQGGDKLSITEGVVSRIEIIPYVLSTRQLLAVQIDAAINPGNSGGPVLQNGKLVGVVMQGMMESQNIGYMIPVPIIQHFLSDMEDGRYDGFPILGVEINNTENTKMRDYYKIGDQEGGVLITHVMPYSPADGILSAGDVILMIDEIQIAMDGTFKFRKDERLTLSHIINSKQINELMRIRLVREGKLEEKEIKVTPFVTIVPPPKYFERPSYYIYGGLVFTVLSVDLLKSWGGKWWVEAPVDFLNYLAGDGRFNEQGQKEVVVLLQVLPDDINVGYHAYQNEVVSKVNGKEIKSFKELILALHYQKEEFTTLEMKNKTVIILNNKNIEQVNQEILKRNNIPAQFSEDVSQWLTEVVAESH